MFYETAKASIQAAINSAENEMKREKALKKALVKANENESKITEQETKIDSIKNELLSRINNAIDSFKNHLNNRKVETEKEINSKIDNTKSYIDEHIKMVNLRIEENNKSTISMICFKRVVNVENGCYYFDSIKSNEHNSYNCSMN
jgi:hypothetical protein